MKALDLYIREMNLTTWNQDQAEVQFLGEVSSHELAALLLTETIQSSLFSSKQPMFALFVDARSAYDVVLRKIFITISSIVVLMDIHCYISTTDSKADLYAQHVNF